MKDKIKKILTIIFIIFAVLFGFSWVKSCNSVENIKTYENVTQTRQKGPKCATEQQEDNKDYIIFDSEIIEKVEMEQEEYLPYDNKITVDLWYYAPDYEYDLKIYFKKGYAYQETININDNFIYSTLYDIDQAFNVSEYHSMYNFSIMHINYEYDDPDDAQITTISLKEDLIKHNFDYLTNRSIIFNNNLSSQFGNNLLPINDFSTTFSEATPYYIRVWEYEYTRLINSETFPMNSNFGKNTFTLNTQTRVNIQFGQGVGQDSGTRFNIYLDPGTYTASCNFSHDNTMLYFNNIMLNRGSTALPYHKYIDISSDRVRLLPTNNNLSNRIFATYFYASSFKTLIPKYEQIPIISLENNILGFSIGTGTETTLQKIYDYIDNVYYNAYGLVPRTLSFSNQFNHNNLSCFILNQYYEGYADYNTEILMTEYLLNNSQPFTTEQIDTYNIGYQIGKSDGIYQALEWTNLIKVLASSLDNFLNIQLLPNITIKILIFIPIMFAILSFIIKAFIR